MAITDRVLRPNGLGSSAEDRSGENRRRRAHPLVARTHRIFEPRSGPKRAEAPEELGRNISPILSVPA